MVVSIPQESVGQKPCVIVEGQADEEISRWLTEEFGASYAVHYVFALQELGFDVMPRSGTGKTDKIELQRAVMKRLEKPVFLTM